MILDIFKKQNNKDISDVSGDDVLDNKRYKQAQGKHGARESVQNESFIVESTPELDLGKILSQRSKELVDKSAGIARSFGVNVIEPVYIFYAIVDNMEEESVKKALLVLDEELSQEDSDPYDHRGEKAEISDETETLLKDALKATLDKDQELVEPESILDTLLKKDYYVISETLNKTGIKLK